MLSKLSPIQKFLSIVVLVSSLLAMPAGSVLAASGGTLNCKQWHTVLYGETIQMVGRRYDTSWRSVAEINNLSDPYALYTGQKLCVSGKIIPVKQAAPLPIGAVRVYATKVIEDKNVQLQGLQLRPKTPYVVYLSKFKGATTDRFKVGTVMTDSKGQFNLLFQIPYKLKDVAKIRVQLDNGWNDQAENWFINANNQGNTGGYSAPLLRISLVSVVKDTKVGIKARNVPANVTYLVYIGKPGAALNQMELVGQLRTNKAGNVTAEYAIPAKFTLLPKLDIRLYNKPLDMGAALTFSNSNQ